MRGVFVSGDPVAVARRRRELLGAQTHEVTDVGEDGGERLLRLVRTPSLFGLPRVVAADNVDALSAAVATGLAGDQGGAVVVGRSERVVPAAVRRILGEAVAFERLAARVSPDEVRRIAAGAGVRLNGGAAQTLVEALDGDLVRADGVVWQLAVLGWDRPTAAQVAAVAGSAGASTPWLVADALARGDSGTVVAASVTPQVLAVLGTDLVRAARLVEAGVSGGAAAGFLGLPGWQAARAVRLAARLPADRVAELLGLLAEAGVAARVDARPERLAALAASMACCFGDPAVDSSG